MESSEATFGEAVLPPDAARRVVEVQLPLACANDRARAACDVVETSQRPKMALPVFQEREKETLRGVKDFLIDLTPPLEPPRVMARPRVFTERKFPKLELEIPEEDDSDWEERDGKSPLADWKPWTEGPRPPKFDADDILSRLSRGASDANRMKLERGVRQTHEEVMREYEREHDDVHCAQRERKMKRQRRMKMEDD
jgi:hypothetical protein